MNLSYKSASPLRGLKLDIAHLPASWDKTIRPVNSLLRKGIHVLNRSVYLWFRTNMKVDYWLCFYILAALVVPGSFLSLNMVIVAQCT